MTCQEQNKAKSLMESATSLCSGGLHCPRLCSTVTVPSWGTGWLWGLKGGARWVRRPPVHAPVSPQTNGAVVDVSDPLILSYKIITALFCPLCSMESSYHSGTDTSSSLQACTDVFIHFVSLSLLSSIRALPGTQEHQHPRTTLQCSALLLQRQRVCRPGSTSGIRPSSIYCSRSRAKLQNKCLAPLLLVSSSERVS